MSGDAITCSGVVLDQHRGELFSVEVEIGGARRRVLAKLAGKLHQNHIRITPGDLVEVEVSPYDTARGRITFRGRRERRA
jgi:translation initiation factor IF-1